MASAGSPGPPTVTTTSAPAEATQPATVSASANSAPQTPPAGGSAISNANPGVYKVGGGVTAPTVIFAPEPQYSRKARAAGLEGRVVLWLVVSADGMPQQIKVQRSLGMGLDEEAVKAVQRWRFQPSTKDGKPVPVMINVEVNFKLYE